MKIWLKDALNKVSREKSADERREQVGGKEGRPRESFAASHVRLCFTHNPPSARPREKMFRDTALSTYVGPICIFHNNELALQ